MSSSRTLSRKLRTSFICMKSRFDPSIILLYIAVFVEQYCDIMQANALPENEGILEGRRRNNHRETQDAAAVGERRDHRHSVRRSGHHRTETGRRDASEGQAGGRKG